MTEYYNGEKILNILDADKENPILKIVTGNRSAGKTTFFSKYLVQRFLKQGKKFALLYRTKTELSNISGKFFKDIQQLFFPEHIMTEKSICEGNIIELYLDEIPCGYGICLSMADKLKKYSHFLSDIETIFFDEFQADRYLTNEYEKFLSVLMTVSRGQGKQYRYVDCILCSNAISLFNPYFTQLRIVERMNNNAKFIRGNGWVMEIAMNESAALAQQKGLGKLMPQNYSNAMNGNVYADNLSTLIFKPSDAGNLLEIKFTFYDFPTGTLFMCGRYENITSYIISECNVDNFKGKCYIKDKQGMTATREILNSQVKRMLRDWFAVGGIYFFNYVSASAFLYLISM